MILLLSHRPPFKIYLWRMNEIKLIARQLRAAERFCICQQIQTGGSLQNKRVLQKFNILFILSKSIMTIVFFLLWSNSPPQNSIVQFYKLMFFFFLTLTSPPAHTRRFQSQLSSEGGLRGRVTCSIQHITNDLHLTSQKTTMEVSYTAPNDD